MAYFMIFPFMLLVFFRGRFENENVKNQLQATLFTKKLSTASEICGSNL